MGVNGPRRRHDGDSLTKTPPGATERVLFKGCQAGGRHLRFSLNGG